MRLIQKFNKTWIILAIIASFGVAISYSSSSINLEPTEEIVPFDSQTVTDSQSTFTDILPKESGTVTPISEPSITTSQVVSSSSEIFQDILPKESGTVTPISEPSITTSQVITSTTITGIQQISSISAPTVSVVDGINVEFTPIVGVVESNISPPSISNVMGINVEFTPIVGVVESNISPPSVSDVEGQFLAVNQIILDPATTSFTFDSADGFTELVITSEGIALNIITVPSDVSGTAMNGRSNLTIEEDGSKTLSFANGFSIDATTADVSVGVVFPDNLEINGPAEWEGIINLPTIKPTTLVDLGEGVEPTAVIEIGADDTPLILNIPIQLTFEGQGDKRVFFTQGGITTEITAICAGNTLADNIGLPEGGDCKITVVDNLVAWTKHLTLASLGVVVLTPSEATEELITLINDDQTISKGTKKGLTGSLKKVSKILDDGKPQNDESACEKLDGFLDYVNEQDGKKLTEQQADEFRVAGEEIKISLGCL